MFKIQETGPIRPPSESRSLLIRLSRNCPWNRCLFCPVYKGEKFSLRSVKDLKAEISCLAALKDKIKCHLVTMTVKALNDKLDNIFSPEEVWDAKKILHWFYHGEFSVFLQDADPLLRKTEELIELIKFIKEQFPETQRITSYARASTIARLNSKALSELKKNGLDRVHTGLESGSDKVLTIVNKGVKSKDVIRAGLLLNEAEIQFSLYFMPGLGGKDLSGDHVSETVRVINAALPSFIRFRSLAIGPSIPLFELYKNNKFEILSEDGMVEEIEAVVKGINVPVQVYSDHNLNLLPEINGKLPEEKARILAPIIKYLSMPNELRLKFIIARRINEVFELSEFLNLTTSGYVQEIYERVISLPPSERENIFMELRSRNL